MIGPDPMPCDHVVFTDFDGVEGILVDLNTKKYYQLNETAMVIWKGLERGLGLEQIAEEIVANYDVTSDDAARKVANLVNELHNYKLVAAR
jgi:coenzyme PQQ synthesis protein D (PqqD)